MTDELKGKVAIITGGAGGIGLATAQLYLRHGAKVLLADLEARKVEEAVKALASDAVRGMSGDVADPAHAAALVKAAVEAFGGLDVLFANAGMEGAVTPLAQYPNELFSKVLDVNVKGPFYAMKAAVPEMVKRGGGSIVVTASVAGLIGSAGLSAYVTSKHALIGLAKSAAIELGPLGIRVNAIAPGPIDNRMMRSIEEQAAPGHASDVKAGFTAQVPLGRYGRNEEIAEMALFLASDRSTNSTGAVFLSDGGFVAR